MLLSVGLFDIFEEILKRKIPCYMLRNIEGNAEEELLYTAVIYRQMIKVFSKYLLDKQLHFSPAGCKNEIWRFAIV